MGEGGHEMVWAVGRALWGSTNMRRRAFWSTRSRPPDRSIELDEGTGGQASARALDRSGRNVIEHALKGRGAVTPIAMSVLRSGCYMVTGNWVKPKRVQMTG